MRKKLKIGKLMEKEITIEELPPSYQHSYGRRKNGRLFLKGAAQSFREKIQWLIRAKYKKEPQDGAFGIEIFFDIKGKRRRDLDNMIKHILDALTGIIWKDDNQVEEIHIYKNKALKNKTTIAVWKL